MKNLTVSLLALSLVLPVLAADKKADLEDRIGKLALKLDLLQAKPDKRIPPQSVRDAKGIILLDRTKAGFLFAYEGGKGIALVRDPKSGQWSPPGFLSANEASLGLQIGGQQSFVVMLLMNTNAIQALTEPKIDFSGEASGTAGNESGGAVGEFSPNHPLVVVYSDRAGLYGGVAFKGGALSPDLDADVAYYGQYLSTKEILFDHKAKPGKAAEGLVQKLEQYSK